MELTIRAQLRRGICHEQANLMKEAMDRPPGDTHQEFLLGRFTIIADSSFWLPGYEDWLDIT